MRTVAESMHDEARLARLSDEGRVRLQRLRAVLDAALADRSRGMLRTRVEASWLALGGPACVAEETDLEDAEIFLDYLESAESAGEIEDLEAFEQGVSKLYARPDLQAGTEDVQLMTIHKAKGLEFDTVIVPGLAGTPRRRDPSLLLWMERAGEQGSARLLLAPVKQAGASGDAIYDYLVRLDERKESEECSRLMYVAATRAKRELHLLGCVRIDDHGGLKPPGAGSLLAKLWPVVEGTFRRDYESSPGLLSSGFREPPIDQRLRRLPLEWAAPSLPVAADWRAPPVRVAQGEPIEFSWAGETARQVGTVVHRWLQRLAEDGLSGWDRLRVAALRDTFRRQLAARGVPGDLLDDAAARVLDALSRAIADERGRWVLGPHTDARSELRLSTAREGRLATVVIDRMFTAEDGVRWIVDYKTSTHQGADREAFLDRERERYRAQLERYATILGVPDAALGLYFPLLGGWRAWRAGSDHVFPD